MNLDMIKKVYQFELNEPATEEAITAEEEKLGFPIPEDYKNFLRTSNGLTLTSCSLYPVEMLAEILETYEVNEEPPSVTVIGTSYGDMFLAMTQDSPAIMERDSGFMEGDEMEFSANNLEEFLLKYRGHMIDGIWAHYKVTNKPSKRKYYPLVFKDYS